MTALLPECLASVMRARRLVEHMDPQDLMIVNEANYPPFGGLVDVAIASGVGVVQFVQPWRDDALLCKRLSKENRRVHPGGVSKDTLRRVAKHWGPTKEQSLWDIMRQRYSGHWQLQLRNEPGQSERGRSSALEDLKLDATKPTIAVFAHVLWDANLFYGEDLFDDYTEWFVETVNSACRNGSANWIVKLHPANSWKRSVAGVKGLLTEEKLLRTRIGPLPRHVHILRPESGISAEALFLECDVGVTVRGTAGLEMPCYGKPVLTAGTGRYSNLGFTVDSSTRDEYLDRLSEAHTYQPLDEEAKTLAQIHAYAALIARHWQMRSFACEFRQRESSSEDDRPVPNPIVDYDLYPLVQSLEELQSLGDLESWARWAAGPTEDYVDIHCIAEN